MPRSERFSASVSDTRSVKVRTLRSGSCRSWEAIEANWSSSELERTSSSAWRSSSALERSTLARAPARSAFDSVRRRLATRMRSAAFIPRATSASATSAITPKAEKTIHGSAWCNPEIGAKNSETGRVRISLQVELARPTESK